MSSENKSVLTDKRSSITERLIADPRKARAWSIKGSPPWLPSMAAVMTPSSRKLEEVINRFVPIGSRLATQKAWWIALHMYLVDRLVEGELADVEQGPIKELLWMSYATSYWGLGEGRGDLSSLPPRRPSEADVAPLIRDAALRLSALEGGNERVLGTLAALVARPAVDGMVHALAYNSAYLISIAEPAPLGVRPQTLFGQGGIARTSDANPLRCDYGIRVPSYLQAARIALEEAAGADPVRFQALMAGQGNATPTLGQVWRKGAMQARAIWDARMLATWSQPRYDVVLSWSLRYNFALEAIALAAIRALLTSDAALARRALRGNLIALGYWGTAAMALQDPDARPPALVPA